MITFHHLIATAKSDRAPDVHIEYDRILQRHESSTLQLVPLAFIAGGGLLTSLVLAPYTMPIIQALEDPLLVLFLM